MRISKLIPFIIFLFTVLFTKGQNKEKHALIIGISNYPKNGGWEKISSDRDIVYMDSVLKLQDFKDIRIVKDAQATKKGIEGAFEKLIADIVQNSNDVVVIHISSHGEQIEDDNNDEADGLDECIVTYNAISPDIYDNDPSMDIKKIWQEYLRDDEFGNYINKLRSKLGKGGDVIVFMDNCHSGSGTRGTAKIRGGKHPLVSASFNELKKYQAEDDGSFKEKSTSATGVEAEMAAYTVISAAKAEETDVESEDDDHHTIGSLTYAISKVLNTLDNKITYRGVFSKIQAVMNIKVPGQHPVIEGNEIDRIFLGGEFVAQKPYFEIAVLKGNIITVKGGLFSGLDINAKVAVYPPRTSDPAKATPITSGTVVKSSGYASEIKLEAPASLLNHVSDGWVFVTVPAFNISPVEISFANTVSKGTTSFSDKEKTQIKAGLSELDIKYDGKPDLILVKGDLEDSIKTAGNGYLYKTIKNSGNDYQPQLKNAIQNYVQYKFLQTFVANDSTIVLEVKLVPVINGKADTAKINSRIRNGQYEFYENDTIALWVKNNSSSTLYINVLDLQPDGVINPALPFKNRNIYPEDLFIIAGQSKLFDKNMMTIYPPYGTEVFKIFASKDIIDMEIIANSAGAQGRGNLSALEKIVQKSYNAGKRGGEINGIENPNGSTYNLLFQIKKR